MRYLPGREAMQRIEEYSIKRVGIPSLALMERAALAVADAVTARFAAGTRVLVCCGMGNNGADGLAMARMLWQRRYQVEIMLVGDTAACTEEFRAQLLIVKRLGIRTGTFGDFEEYLRKEQYAVIVDALFGIGLSRPVGGVWRDVIARVNQADAFVVAVDVPSGIHSDHGGVMGEAVKADLTVTFGYEKLGLALYPGKEYAGEVQVCDIGLLEAEFNGLRAYTYGPEDVARLSVRSERSHKGSCGKVLVVAGSVNLSGAAYLAAKAAYRMGAGLVQILTPEANRSILQASLPEAILSTYDPEWFSVAGLQEICDWADAVVIGPGLGTADYVRSLVNYMLQYSRVPIVLDADALNMMAKNPNMTALLSGRMVVTPHLAEMARLTGRAVSAITETLAETAMAYSRTTGAVCVLKDARTVVSDGGEEFYLNTSGSPAMATAGSGDVLSGMIGALLAGGMPTFEAAKLGVHLHGLAGEAAAKACGIRSAMASDILAGLTQVLRMANR